MKVAYPDPTALPDNEGPAPVYSSTQTKCVTCAGAEDEVAITPDGVTIYDVTKIRVHTDPDGNGLTDWQRIRVWGSTDGVTWTLILNNYDVQNNQAYTDYVLEAPASVRDFKVERRPLITEPPYERWIEEDVAVQILEQVDQECATATATSNLSQTDADAKAEILAEVMASEGLNCPGESTNELPVQFNNGTNKEGALYPSAKVVSGLDGVVTKVTVSLNQIRHYAFQVARLLLVSPSGEKVLLWGVDNTVPGNETTFVTPTDIVLDDDGGSDLPTISNVPAGTYKPTVGTGIEAIQFPGDAPSQPYAKTLAEFNGIDPNGAWKLYAYHVQYYSGFASANAVILDGWDLTITSA